MLPMKFSQLALWAVLLLAIVLPRFTDLERFITGDEKRWQANVAGFTMKLAHGRIGELLQQPHPGITTQWFASPGIWQESWAGKKVPLIVAQSILLLFAGYLMGRLWGKGAGILGIIILAIHPSLIAHTRVYAMDSLLAIFVLISLLSLLVWNKKQKTRYLVYAGCAAALAALSKLPGILLVPYEILAIAWFLRHLQWNIQIKKIGIYLAFFAAASILVLPSLLVRPLGVLGDMKEFFFSGDYTVLHQYGPMYYIGTLLFLSTPIFIAALFAAFIHPAIIRRKKDIIFLLLFALAFTIAMSIGAKKGDRYILPTLLLLETCAVYVAAQVWKKKHAKAGAMLLVAAGALQIINLAQMHPYYLAYVNPIAKPWIGNRQLGWGEGLDIAAEYINQKPSSENLSIATYYSSQGENLFTGSVAPLHQWDSGSHDYAILYRAMYGRSADAWETDVLNQFKAKTPEKTIFINGIPYIWIYNLKE